MKLENVNCGRRDWAESDHPSSRVTWLSVVNTKDSKFCYWLREQQPAMPPERLCSRKTNCSSRVSGTHTWVYLGVDAWGHLTSPYLSSGFPSYSYLQVRESYLHFKERLLACLVYSPGLTWRFICFLSLSTRLLVICVRGLFSAANHELFWYLGLVCNQFYNPSLHLSTGPGEEATGIVLSEVS